MRRITYTLLALLPLLATQALADGKAPTPPKSTAPITIDSRFTLVRTLNAEFVRVKKLFPQGDKGITIRDGKITPDDMTLAGLVAGRGPAARPGDKAQITNIEFQENKIIFEINGGPKKKAKWYQRIRISSSGGETPIASQPNEDAKGSYVALAFDKYVPNLTVDEVKKMLVPVFDFGAGPSATNQYEESLPPKVRAALKNHDVLVGMNRELVVQAVGRPDQKVREKGGEIEYEEWIYGMPPADVKFIRFVGDEVTQVKIMKEDGTRIVRTEKEVELNGQTTAVAQAPKPSTATSADQRPSLRRPGEEAPDANTRVTPQNAPVIMPPDAGQSGPRMPNGGPAPDGDPGAPPH
jgi:hypothetical protein